jgi:hypothetical protein
VKKILSTFEQWLILLCVVAVSICVGLSLKRYYWGTDYSVVVPHTCDPVHEVCNLISCDGEDGCPEIGFHGVKFVALSAASLESCLSDFCEDECAEKLISCETLPCEEDCSAPDDVAED